MNLQRTALTALAVGTLLMNGLGSASAQTAALPKVCFPLASNIPGYTGANALPSWLSSGDYQRPDQLNEPRWAPGPLRSFYNDPGNGDSNEGGFRLVLSQDRRTLAVSIQEKADNIEKTPADSVSFGIYKGGYGRAATIALRSGPMNGSDPTYYAAGQSITAYQTSTLAGNPTVWTDDPQSAPWIRDVASWTRHDTSEGGADWGIQFKVDLTPFNLGSGDFQIHIGMRKARGDTTAATADDSITNLIMVDPAISMDYMATDFIGSTIDGTYLDTTGIPRNANHWTHPNLLNEGCPAGLEFASYALVGTQAADGSLTNRVVAGPNQTNTFVARALTNGIAVQPNWLQARFRIANWGAQVAVPEAKWSTLAGGAAVLNRAETSDLGYADAFPGSNGTYVEWRHQCLTPAGASARTACGVTFDANANADQCMLVEIQPVGVRQIPIKTASVYRNMRFEGLSHKELKAEVSIKGLRARTRRFSGARDVHLQVVTRNMPDYGSFPLFLDSYLMNLLKAAFTGALVDLNLFNTGLSLGIKDLMKMVWPTYEIHAYWDAGRLSYANGRKFKMLKPMNSFGYYFSHDGLLFGYQHGLTRRDAGAFSSPQPGYHVVRAADEGTVQIQTAVSAEEIPQFLAPVLSTFCELFPFACGDGGGQ